MISSPSHASSGSPPSARDDCPISPTSTRSRSSFSNKPYARASRTSNPSQKAAHNRNEQERRRKMNSSFEALAELIPNLSHRLNGRGRAPSRPEVLASTMAYIRALRRHTALAASELRYMKEENDGLRDQLNMWRRGRGETPIDEPLRGEGFGKVWNQEVEVMAEDNVGGIEEEDRTDSGEVEAEIRSTVGTDTTATSEDFSSPGDSRRSASEESPIQAPPLWTNTVMTTAHQRHEQDIAGPSSFRTVHPATNVHNYAPHSHDDSYFRQDTLHAGSSTSLYPIYNYVPSTNPAEYPRTQTHTPTVPSNVDTRFDVQ
ncbi:hypothetical protein VNI00_009252 [Paramarasmius palmivorus]|uniref:BHLH domain-containing protein n=1 Tax=Paramarasmius palmivorus TaxID=297713 RepID=A0AAW0CRA6_9AGAR